jgi:3-hydroxyisobutyrate dehydrogenase-like beta-hydroxyacid dehydrogenase
MTIPSTITLIGFGEVGQIFARGLLKAGVTELRTFDIAFGQSAAPQRRAADEIGATACASPAEAIGGSGLVISAVTAAATLEAAASVVPDMPKRAFFLDLNSVAPATKAAAAALIDRAGGRYVEAAVMASVPPKGLRTTMLLGGPHAAAFEPVASALGLAATFFSPVVGKASSVKMCRSVLIKGLEALSMESLLAARHYGVEREVLESLKDTFQDWPELALYMINRSLQHGTRRAEEMREVAKTVRDAGVEPLMSTATVERQDWAARTRAKLGNEAREADEIGDLLDAIRTALAPEGLPTPALETLARSKALQIDACAGLDSDDGHSKAPRDKLVTKPALPNVNDVRAVRAAAPNDNAVQPET